MTEEEFRKSLPFDHYDQLRWSKNRFKVMVIQIFKIREILDWLTKQLNKFK